MRAKVMRLLMQPPDGWNVTFSWSPPGEGRDAFREGMFSMDASTANDLDGFRASATVFIGGQMGGDGRVQWSVGGTGIPDPAVGVYPAELAAKHMPRPLRDWFDRVLDAVGAAKRGRYKRPSYAPA